MNYGALHPTIFKLVITSGDNHHPRADCYELVKRGARSHRRSSKLPRE